MRTGADLKGGVEDIRGASEPCEDIVCDLSGGLCTGCVVMVCDLPGGGAAPNISEKAASL